MSLPKGGLSIKFEPARREMLKNAAREFRPFSVELSALDWRIDRKELFLVSFSDNADLVECAAIGRRKHGPRNTAAVNVEFSRFVFFETTFSIPSFTDKISISARAGIKDREGGRGKWFPPSTWLELFEMLKKRFPRQAEGLDDIWAAVNSPELIERSLHVQKLALQRDAIGVSLDIAGLSDLRRQSLRGTRRIDKESEVESFIELMDNTQQQERMFVDHDRYVLESAIAAGSSTTAEFSKGPRSLRVWTVDRDNIEKFTGIDLVILNKDYNNLLMIQYKCMKEENSKPSNQWRFRPDPQFKEDVKRMREVRNFIKTIKKTSSTLEDVRMNRGSLFFKFCKRLPLVQQDGELADGMFISLSTTEKFFASPASLGPNEGRFISYENFERYFNNSLFSTLARDGWIGTRGLTGNDYKKALGLIQRDNRGLVIAETLTDISPDAPRILRRLR